MLLVFVEDFYVCKYYKKCISVVIDMFCNVSCILDIDVS